MGTLTKADRLEIRALAKNLMDTYGSPSTVGREDIMFAELKEDLDKLRTYVKLLPEEGVNTRRLNIVIDFYRRQGIQELAPFLTRELTIAIVDTAIAIAEGTEYASGYLEDSSYDQLVLEALNHMDRIDDVVTLISKRHILDRDSMVAMLEQMSNHHPAVTTGLL
jgi:hypothetical protein